MNWERVTIFISSTFNDMHAERDYLVKDVFPELREWCEERKIHLVDVDLRWGVTEKDSNSNNTVLACLNNIDESRPFFLCFQGQRRGWVPGEDDISHETLEEYPGVSQYVGTNSVTEMEIEHALLSPMKHIVDGNEKPEVPVNHALFYFRNPDYLESLANEQRKIFTNESEKDIELANKELKRFKDKIKNEWIYTTDYESKWDSSIISPELPENVNQGRLTDFNIDGKPLKETIIKQLKEEIIKEFPDRKKVKYSSPLERDLDQQALFIELNSEGFISREGDFDDLNRYLSNDKNGLFVLTAPAGYGKSMLLANFIKRESKKHDMRFFNRFCGVSDLSSEQFSLWKSILDEAKIKSPDTLKDLKNNIDKLIGEIAKEKTTIIIDALNQLPDGLDMLGWLPNKLPKNLKIILSIKEDEKIVDTIENLKNNEKISYSNVKPLENKKEKKKLIKDYLKKYLKALDEEQIDTICDFKGSANPLYLKILLSELRVFGSFDQLSEEIKQFGQTPQEAFNTVLERLEKDINSLNINSQKFIPLLFGLLANARTGLSEKELKSCIQKKLTTIEDEKLISAIHFFIRQVKPFMARRKGRYDYFYESFKKASQKRYENKEIYYNGLLADYFQLKTDPEKDYTFTGKSLRDFNELPYHLANSNKIAILEDILSKYTWIKNKTELNNIFHTINDYNYINIENKENYHLKLIKNTLTMSSHFIKDNIKELPTQLWGRLKTHENHQIKEFLNEIEKHTRFPWLQPHHFMHTSEGSLQTTLTGHTQWVRSVCFSPDGKYIASGSDDDTIRVWNIEKNEEKTILKGHALRVNSVCFSPDGKYIVSGSPDNTVRVWDWKKDEEKTILRHHTSVESVCFSPDGKYIVSGLKNGNVRVWDWEKNEEKTILEGQTSRVESVCFSPDGKYIASGSNDATVRVWDWEKNEEKTILKGHTKWVNSVCFSPDGKYIASGSADSTVRVWDWEKNEEKTILKGHTGHVECVCFSPDGKYIASGLSDSNVRVWDWKKNEEKTVLRHSASVECVCFSPDGKYIVSAGGEFDRTVHVWDWEKNEEKTTLEGHAGHVENVCFSPDGKYIASGSSDIRGEDNTVRVWDWKKNEEKTVLRHTDRVHSVCFSPDGKYIASGSWDSTVRVWDWEKNEEKTIFKGQTRMMDSVCFSSDGKYILSGSGGTVCVWDWEKNEEKHKTIILINTDEGINSCSFSNNNQHITAGGSSGQILIYSIKNLSFGKTIVTPLQDTNNNLKVRCSYCAKTFNIPEKGLGNIIKCHHCDEKLKVNDFTTLHLFNENSELNQFVIKPHSSEIASTNDNREEIKEFSLEEIESNEIIKKNKFPMTTTHQHIHTPERQLKTTFKGHTQWVRSVCFSPDGKYIASGSDDCTIRVWDIEKNEEKTILKGHAHRMNSVCFSPDGKYIVSGSWDKTVRVWDWKKDEEKTILRHPTSVDSVCFSPDGKYIVSGSKNGNVHVWKWEKNEEKTIFKEPTLMCGVCVFLLMENI